jgi:hypothetical protein
MIQEQRQQALADQAQRIMEKAERKIWVTFSREGIHRYPEAATDPNLCTAGEYDVSFLANPHRHLFKFCVWIDVWHSNRDLEFIQFKRWLESLYSKDILQLDFKSVEMLADDLYVQIAERYPERAVWIEISEDGENGCLVKYDLTRPAQNIKI